MLACEWSALIESLSDSLQACGPGEAGLFPRWHEFQGTHFRSTPHWQLLVSQDASP